MRLYQQKGFTLIELLIVVAIIGILAAIAAPAYHNNVKRAHITEGLHLASATKFAVYEYYHWNGNFPVDNDAAALAAPEEISGSALKSITVENGIIKLSFNQKVAHNATILITPSITNGSIQWDCTGGTVEQNFRPSACRTR